jgi:hypothetical protein
VAQQKEAPMKLTPSSIFKLMGAVLRGISWLTQFALPAALALGFFVAWIAFGPVAMLFLVPLLVRQKPDLTHGERPVHIWIGVIATGLTASYAIGQLYTGGQIQELAEPLAKLRSVRSGIADSAATSVSPYHAHVFLGEALGGLMMAILAFYFLAKPGRYHDMLTLTRDEPWSVGWGRSVFLFIAMVTITLIYTCILLNPELTRHDSAVVHAGIMPIVALIWLQQATGAIRILPRLLPDVEARQ